ncbi:MULTISPECIES: DUF2948 family protein [unclassified Mesorhizobium]|uniref:DUF2948 family protein n=1 Tax=unclassified Mesorhizobium TaxID=325217 RepID=UPI000F756BD0|nr:MULTISPECIES: DUF2948 family protein [unclassified Mesorhizobium]AZO05590.1 DUF2948 family protein [Mesorhizobium sp. M2A.F.Ca.ET.043.02.1.1]RUW40356.1 DUF2948 family protein [Mesorhizobium sp. M2A.F.Ca.ET.015.02.1.1]RUW81506.1 DUF2948 family protein [Mesorhizobium sp. M2A.F.Ca.ET.067.02.1.1]RVC96282.1 DUF2948 family protein [Mesorhizobium sp. M2A.F.Ca.ET.017.03.2.1]RVD03219.1 DUF2948 family protein [Mesorhizobium sp. M2A.F.Ca.ET.029.05.1.1]
MALKLIALDDQDLSIVSAHVQDAVMKVSDLEYLPAAKRFVLTMNRFVWEAKSGLFRQHNERRQSVLHFDRVLGVKTSGIQRDKPAEVLSLLAISFIAISKPAGIVELVFSGGGTIMLDVECVEARLADVGGAWEATSRPVHRG